MGIDKLSACEQEKPNFDDKRGEVSLSEKISISAIEISDDLGFPNTEQRSSKYMGFPYGAKPINLYSPVNTPKNNNEP